MHAVNITTLLLIIIGGVNWLLVGLFQVDLVASIFGGATTTLARAVYILVGLSALWQLVPWVGSFGAGEVASERDLSSGHGLPREPNV